MTDAPQTCPVHDWASDYDIFDPDYVRDPAPVWDELRERCPMAHTERWGGSWMPTRYEDLQQLVKMVPTLSSRSAVVVPPSPELREVLVAEAKKYGSGPPITADPPEHQPFRRLILPFFSPHAVEKQIPYTRALCNSLIDGFIGKGRADAAADYAQQITPRVIAHVIGIDPARADEFVDWVRGLLEFGQTQPELRIKYRGVIRDFFQEMVTERRANPGDDAISTLIRAEVDGKKLDDYKVVGVCVLLLVAGIDTTWSSISSSLLHFATHAQDQAGCAPTGNCCRGGGEAGCASMPPVTMGAEGDGAGGDGGGRNGAPATGCC